MNIQWPKGFIKPATYNDKLSEKKSSNLKKEIEYFFKVLQIDKSQIKHINLFWCLQIWYFILETVWCIKFYLYFKIIFCFTISFLFGNRCRSINLRFVLSDKNSNGSLEILRWIAVYFIENFLDNMSWKSTLPLTQES